MTEETALEAPKEVGAAFDDIAKRDKSARPSAKPELLEIRISSCSRTTTCGRSRRTRP